MNVHPESARHGRHASGDRANAGGAGSHGDPEREHLANAERAAGARERREDCEGATNRACLRDTVELDTSVAQLAEAIEPEGGEDPWPRSTALHRINTFFKDSRVFEKCLEVPRIRRQVHHDHDQHEGRDRHTQIEYLVCRSE